MTITPKLKPGQLIKFDHPANSTLGLVKSVSIDRTWRTVQVLVQWCNDSNTEEYVWQEDLKLVETL